VGSVATRVAAAVVRAAMLAAVLAAVVRAAAFVRAAFVAPAPFTVLLHISELPFACEETFVGQTLKKGSTLGAFCA